MPGSNHMRRPYPIVGTRWWAIDTLRGVILIDEDVADIVGPRHVQSRDAGGERGEYPVVCLPNGKRTYLHRLILGVSDRWQFVDHANHDPLDCRRCNLRLATPTQNQANRHAAKKRNGQFKGVVWLSPDRWGAQIGGPQTYLGAFPSAEEAARAYDREALQRWGSFARLNFPATTTPGPSSKVA